MFVNKHTILIPCFTLYVISISLEIRTLCLQVELIPLRFLLVQCFFQCIIQPLMSQFEKYVKDLIIFLPQNTHCVLPPAARPAGLWRQLRLIVVIARRIVVTSTALSSTIVLLSISDLLFVQ